MDPAGLDGVCRRDQQRDDGSKGAGRSAQGIRQAAALEQAQVGIEPVTGHDHDPGVPGEDHHRMAAQPGQPFPAEHPGQEDHAADAAEGRREDQQHIAVPAHGHIQRCAGDPDTHKAQHQVQAHHQAHQQELGDGFQPVKAAQLRGDALEAEAQMEEELGHQGHIQIPGQAPPSQPVAQDAKAAEDRADRRGVENAVLLELGAENAAEDQLLAEGGEESVGQDQPHGGTHGAVIDRGEGVVQGEGGLGVHHAAEHGQKGTARNEHEGGRQEEEQMGEQIVFYHPQKSISTSHDHILFCRQDGTVTARGENEDGECDTEEWTNVVAVAAGHGSSFGVRTDGTVLYAGNERLENVEYWENMIDVQPWNFGAVGLTKDGTILAMHPQDYGEEFEIMQKNMTSWENIKAIAAIDWDVFGLTEDGRVLSALNENSVITEGWNDVDYLLTDIYLGNSGLLSGLCADGTVRSVQLEDTSNAFYQENMASQTKVTQLSNRICVHEDGTVSIIDAYEGSDYQEEKMRETVESWTNVEAAAMFSHRTGYYYALKEDGTILYSAPNMGNAELNEFKNLEWIRLIEEEGTESLIAYTKDGRILATGGYSGLSDLIMSMNVDESMEDQMMISMDLANALRENPEMREEIEMEMMMLEMEGIDIAPNLDAEYRETIWTSPHYYEQLCEAASKVVYFDEEVLLRKDGTTIFHNNTEKIYTNVVDVENSNLDAVLYEDGTVELTSDTPHYKDINEWTNVIQLATYNRRLRGLCADGTILNEYSDTLNEGIPNAKVKSIYASENLHLGITEEDKVVVIENRGMTEDKGMLVVDAWENVKSLALGKSHTVGLLKDGTVVATGRNNAGQCDVEAWTDVVSIVAGSACTLGLTSNGDLLIAGELY